MAKYLLLLMLLMPAPAFAHKLNLFAQARGATISGRAYFSGDSAARQVDVIARDASGSESGRTKTDDDGRFTLVARSRADYHLTAETPDGHAASYVLAAAELPDSLPVESNLPAAPPAFTETIAAGAAAANSNSDPAASAAGIEALQKQIEALRTQIDQSEQRLRFRDILGGIGYILGLAGIGFYFKAQRSKSLPMTRRETAD